LGTALGQRNRNLGKAGKFGDLKRRLMFLLGALIVYRLGATFPCRASIRSRCRAVPGPAGRHSGHVQSVLGRRAGRFTIFALNIMPYISASIIMQLMTAAAASLEALKKEGEAGRRKINQYTRYGTVLLATVQASASPWGSNRARLGGHRSRDDVPAHLRDDAGDRHDVPDVAGRADHRARRRQRHFDHHFRRHRAGLPSAIGGLLELVRTGAMHALTDLHPLVFLVTGFVVFVERGQRKILVNYAKRQVGNKVFGGRARICR
jgi:preprotein translocase subunit SecY